MADLPLSTLDGLEHGAVPGPRRRGMGGAGFAPPGRLLCMSTTRIFVFRNFFHELAHAFA